MKGRGSPQQQKQGGRGRGYFGRGGRGNAPANQHQRGTIPQIGAYLDLPPGKEIAPGAVTKWMIKLKEYSMSNNDTTISLIFGQDGTLGDYPVYVVPSDPGVDATPIDKEKWKIDYAEYKKLVTKLKDDKRKLYGFMLGQMSESSKIRAREDPVGEEAVTEFDPRKLLQAILSTHIGDSTLEENHQLFNIIQRYNVLVMGSHESLSNYYTNFRSALTGIEQAYARIGQHEIDGMYPESQMAIKFTMGLNHHYDEFKSFYTNRLKPWPNNLNDANFEATKFNPIHRRVAAQANAAAFERANAFAFHERGGRGGRGYPGGRNGKSTPNGKWVRDGPGPDSPEGYKNEKGSTVAVYTASKTPPLGYKSGPCNNCNKYGHFAQECREEAQPMEKKRSLVPGVRAAKAHHHPHHLQRESKWII